MDHEPLSIALLWMGLEKEGKDIVSLSGEKYFLRKKIFSCGNKRKRFWITAIEIFIVEFKAILNCHKTFNFPPV